MLELKKALEIYFEKAELLDTDEEINELRTNIGNMVSMHDYETFIESTDINKSDIMHFYQHLAKVIAQSHLIREKASSWLNNTIMNTSISIYKQGYLKNDKKGNPVFKTNYINGFNAAIDFLLSEAEKEAIKEINKSNLSKAVKNVDISRIKDFFETLPEYAKHADTFVGNYDAIVKFIENKIEDDDYKSDVKEMLDVYFKHDEYQRRLKKKGK